MKIRLLYQGKPKKNIFEKAEQIYVKRISNYVPFELVRLEPLKLSKSLSILEVKSKEEVYYKNKLPGNSLTILLDEKGKHLNSLSFSDFVNHNISHQSRDITFVIGGAYGFSDGFKNSSNFMISLSELTYSHHLARVVFLEQLYRAFSIINGEPYHNI